MIILRGKGRGIAKRHKQGSFSRRKTGSKKIEKRIQATWQ
jgi:hypothetical protein